MKKESLLSQFEATPKGSLSHRYRYGRIEEQQVLLVGSEGKSWRMTKTMVQTVLVMRKGRLWRLSAAIRQG